MSRSKEVKTDLWRIYCLKRGKLVGLRYSSPPKPSFYLKALGRRPFPDFIEIHLHRGNRRNRPPRLSKSDGGQVEVAWGPPPAIGAYAPVGIVQVRFNVVKRSIGPGQGLCFQVL
jgi:hypothetical protein